MEMHGAHFPFISDERTGLELRMDGMPGLTLNLSGSYSPKLASFLAVLDTP